MKVCFKGTGKPYHLEPAAVAAVVAVAAAVAAATVQVLEWWQLRRPKPKHRRGIPWRTSSSI